MLTVSQAEEYARKLIKEAESCHEIGPYDLIDEIEGLTHIERMQVWDAIFDLTHHN